MRLLPVLLVTAVLFAACGDDAEVSSGPGDTDPGTTAPAADDPLAGRTFLSNTVTEDGTDRPLVDGSRISLTFDDGRVSANAGCNTMGSGYSVDGDTLVVEAEMMSTQMGCDAALMDQDEWLAGVLGASPTFVLDDAELTLTSDGTVIALTDRTVADPDRSLTDVLWTMDSIITGDAVANVAGMENATLKIAADGTYQVNTGCNTGSGTAEVGDGTVTFDPPRLTKVACKDDQAQEIETALLGILEGEQTFAIEAANLTIMGSDGRSGVGFTAP